MFDLSLNAQDVLKAHCLCMPSKNELPVHKENIAVFYFLFLCRNKETIGYCFLSTFKPSKLVGKNSIKCLSVMSHNEYVTSLADHAAYSQAFILEAEKTKPINNH